MRLFFRLTACAVVAVMCVLAHRAEQAHAGILEVVGSDDATPLTGVEGNTFTITNPSN